MQVDKDQAAISTHKLNQQITGAVIEIYFIQFGRRFQSPCKVQASSISQVRRITCVPLPAILFPNSYE